MLCNYHTHTFRNRHSSGTEREYIEAAIGCGIQTLGFSEHAPYRYPDGYSSWFHLQQEELEDYVATILSLKEEYAGKIDILLGFEAEFYPKLFDEFLAIIRPYPVDYMILGQHFLQNEYDGRSSGTPTDDPDVLHAYVEQCIQGMQTVCFSYLAHPDLLEFTGSDALYTQEMQALCRAAKELDVPLEINLHGLVKKRHYPCERFFRIAGDSGCTVVAGLDAHSADGIFQPGTCADYHALVERCGLTVTDCIPLKEPFGSFGH